MLEGTKMPTSEMQTKMNRDSYIDLISAAICLFLFVIIIDKFQYHGVLGETDLYRVLVGMIDGARTGTGFNSNLQYGKDFSFGYILALYTFAPADVLRNPDKLTTLINNIGFYSIIFGLFFFWLSVSLLHGFRAASIALALFAFSPMVLELSTSGHQIIPAFGFFWAAAACSSYNFTGWRAALATIAATLLLICGLSVRAEIVLVLPYLVLMRINLTTWQTFLRSVEVNAIAPSAAFIAFLALRFSLASVPRSDTETTVIVNVFENFFRLSHVIPGFAYMALRCGLATVLVAAGLGVLIIIGKFRPRVQDAFKVTLEQLIGPAILILLPFVFWLLDPAPSRHFMLTLAGISILIGWAISNLPALRFVSALVTVLGIIAANQILSEAVRPTLLRMNAAWSPFRLPPEFYTTLTMAPLGWSWQHHTAIDARWHHYNALGDKVATSCDANTAIFSDNAEQIIARLYAAGWRPNQSNLFRIHGFLAYSGNLGTHHYVVIINMSGHPKDAVAEVLADPYLDDYKLYADPYITSIYDKTAIPDTRLARFGC